MGVCPERLPFRVGGPLVSLVSMSVALRAGIPPFYVMDVWLAAPEHQRTHAELGHLSARPTDPAPPSTRRPACRARAPPRGCGKPPRRHRIAGLSVTRSLSASLSYAPRSR